MIDNRVEEIRKHITAISNILGIPVTESNEDTPLRIAKMYCNELFRNRNCWNIEELNAQMKTFPNPASSNSVANPVTMSGIKFHSMCEHHWLPFMGVAEVSYAPRDRVIGLSKIPRVVKYFSQMPQLQEKLTSDIGTYLFDLLNPLYIKVTLTATHCCVMCRGAESECETETVFERYSEDLYVGHDLSNNTDACVIGHNFSNDFFVGNTLNDGGVPV